jgi:hypothetical protein
MEILLPGKSKRAVLLEDPVIESLLLNTLILGGNSCMTALPE